MTPSQAFGNLLDTVAKRQFGTLTAYAKAVGVGLSAIRRYTKGDAVSVGARSLEQLVAPLTSLVDRERLYNAWRVAYAPSPVESGLPTIDSSDEEIMLFASGIYELIGVGRLPLVTRRLESLWAELRDSDRHECWMYVSRALAEAHFLAANPVRGVQTAIELRKLAVKRYEPAWVVRALWQEAIGLGNAFPRELAAPERAFRALERYLEDWQPRSAEERDVHLEFRRTYLRDRVRLLAGEREHVTESEPLGILQEALVDDIDSLPDELGKGIVLDIAARGFTTLGNFEAAEAALDAIDPLAVAPDSLQGIKSRRSRALLLIAQEQFEEAEAEVEAALGVAESLSFTTYADQLRDLRTTLGRRRLRAYL